MKFWSKIMIFKKYNISAKNTIANIKIAYNEQQNIIRIHVTDMLSFHILATPCRFYVFLCVCNGRYLIHLTIS